MKILMVCLGNICRSPLAHGILEHKAKQLGINLTVDSAGTNGLHDGEQPDSRSMKKALEYGVDISNQRSRQIKKRDFAIYDHIYVMDASNYSNVIALATTTEEKSKVKMIMNEVNEGKNLTIPDPYYGGEDGFEQVYQMLDLACDKVIEKIKK